MESTVIGAGVFACLFSSSLLGMFVRARQPRTAAVRAAIGVVGRGVTLVAVLAALVLGVGAMTMKADFDVADRQVKRLAEESTELDRNLRFIGEPARPARELLFQFVAHVTRDTWPDLRPALPLDATPASTLRERLREALLTMSVTTDSQRQSLADARRVLRQLTDTRWTMYEYGDGQLSPWLLGATVLWLMLTFVGFGLAAPRNRMVVGAMLAVAFSLGGVTFLLADFGTPYSGLIAVDPAPLQDALYMLSD
jgi:hypothetical protein